MNAKVFIVERTNYHHPKNERMVLQEDIPIMTHPYPPERSVVFTTCSQPHVRGRQASSTILGAACARAFLNDGKHILRIQRTYALQNSTIARKVNAGTKFTGREVTTERQNKTWARGGHTQ